MSIVVRRFFFGTRVASEYHQMGRPRQRVPSHRRVRIVLCCIVFVSSNREIWREKGTIESTTTTTGILGWGWKWHLSLSNWVTRSTSTLHQVVTIQDWRRCGGESPAPRRHGFYVYFGSFIKEVGGGGGGWCIGATSGCQALVFRSRNQQQSVPPVPISTGQRQSEALLFSGLWGRGTWFNAKDWNYNMHLRVDAW